MCRSSDACGSAQMLSSTWWKPPCLGAIATLEQGNTHWPIGRKGWVMMSWSFHKFPGLYPKRKGQCQDWHQINIVQISLKILIFCWLEAWIDFSNWLSPALLSGFNESLGLRHAGVVVSQPFWSSLDVVVVGIAETHSSFNSLFFGLTCFPWSTLNLISPESDHETWWSEDLQTISRFIILPLDYQQLTMKNARCENPIQVESPFERWPVTRLSTQVWTQIACFFAEAAAARRRRRLGGFAWPKDRDWVYSSLTCSNIPNMNLYEMILQNVKL